MASIYTAALMEHNAHPDYKYQMDEPTCTHDGVNPSCGDELTLSLRLRGDRIEEAAFTGHGCAVSQAAADMMADLVTGETVGEARRLSGLNPSGTNISTLPPTMVTAIVHHQPVCAASATVRAIPAKGTRLIVAPHTTT